MRRFLIFLAWSVVILTALMMVGVVWGQDARNFASSCTIGWLLGQVIDPWRKA